MNSSGDYLEMVQGLSEQQFARLKSSYQFYMFFAALTFALFSVAVEFPIYTHNFWMNISQIFSWVLFIVSGVSMLFIFKNTLLVSDQSKLMLRLDKTVWTTFVLGIIVQFFCRIVNLYL